MAEVTKPVALNESLNTTDSTPKNIADVLKDKLGDIASAISGGGGSSGGHIIQNASGANMPQEPTMQFMDSHVSDDSTNEKTIIENIKSVTEAQFESATEDGLYDVDVEGAEIGEISEDYVEVTADGVKTYGTLLSELFVLTDTSKITKDTKLKIGTFVLYIDDIDVGATTYRFERINALTTSYAVLEYLGFRNSPFYRTVTLQTNGTTFSDTLINGVPSNGTKLTLYYGNDKAVVDLQTTANRCWYDSENTVKDILKKTISVLDYQADYAYNVWTTHTKTFTELTTIENAFISIIGGWTTSSPHEATIVTISRNTVTYACKGMWSGGSSGITVMITAIGK